MRGFSTAADNWAAQASKKMLTASGLVADGTKGSSMRESFHRRLASQTVDPTRSLLRSTAVRSANSSLYILIPSQGDKHGPSHTADYRFA